MSQPQPQQISGQRTQWVTYAAFAAVMCKHHCLSCSGVSSHQSLFPSLNLESSTQSCVQLHVSNPVITGPSAPSKTIIGTSCLFVLSFSSPELHHDQFDICKPISGPPIEPIFFNKWGQFGPDYIYPQLSARGGGGGSVTSSMANLYQISHESMGDGVWLSMSGGIRVQQNNEQNNNTGWRNIKLVIREADKLVAMLKGRSKGYLKNTVSQ